MPENVLADISTAELFEELQRRILGETVTTKPKRYRIMWQCLDACRSHRDRGPTRIQTPPNVDNTSLRRMQLWAQMFIDEGHLAWLEEDN